MLEIFTEIITSISKLKRHYDVLKLKFYWIFSDIRYSDIFPPNMFYAYK